MLSYDFFPGFQPMNRFVFAPPQWFDSLDSTNTFLKEQAATGDAASGAVVAALLQTKGRGRMGNTWHATADGDIAMSFLWQGAISPILAGSLPMACALAVRDFLASPPWGLSALCKWPNDVLADGGKICGILTESTLHAGGNISLIVGIGINIRSNPLRDRELGRKTAAVETFAGPVSEGAHDLLPKFLACLEKRVNEWQDDGATIIQAMRSCLWGLGKTVSARTRNGVISGLVVGLGDDASLLLQVGEDIVPISSVNALESGWE